MKYFLPCLFLSLLLACSSEKPNNNSTTNPINENTTSSIKNGPAKMIVGLDHFRMRETPGKDGKEIGFLDKGAVVYETGEVSDFTTRVKLRGIWFDEPWIKVKTEEGLEGWLFAGGLIFDTKDQSALSEKLLDLRLRSFFGNGITKDLLSYRKAFRSAKTSEDFSNLFRTGELLRDTMVTILEKKINVPELDYDQLPDLFWVEGALPGYETALVAEGTIYYLFQNFKSFDQVAKRTSGKEDDDFIQLNFKVHEADSVEYFFPAWFIQTWDYGGHSLLGQGKHLSILITADSNIKKSILFMDQAISIKDRLIDDIVGKHWTYWEPANKIKEEIDAILAAELSILTKEDIIALETRSKMFTDASANKIEVNHKAGME